VSRLTQEALELAQALVRTPSPTGDEGAAIEIAAAAMSRYGFEVTIDAAGNAIGTLGRAIPGAPRILFDGHIDTVPLPAPGSWSRDPLAGSVEGGRLYGLGVCDQKASLAAAVVGIGSQAHRLASAPGLVSLVASVSEEFMEGAALCHALDRLKPTCVVVTEPSELRLMVGHRGRAKLEVRITGRAAHAARSSSGISAVEALADLLHSLRALPERRHETLGARDITCIDVVSSPYPSVSTVPDGIVARFDIRFLPDDTESGLHALLLEAAQRAWVSWPARPGITVDTLTVEQLTYTGMPMRVREYAAGWETVGPVVETAGRALVEAGLDGTPAMYDVCTNGALSAGERGIPTIGFGVGEQHMAHRADEYVEVAALARAVPAYGLLAVALGEEAHT
jgi:putative selenium metabolism hydrolase